LNLSLNSNIDFSNILYENRHFDFKLSTFQIDFTSEDENKNEKQKSLFRNSINSDNNDAIPNQNIKIEPIKNQNLENSFVENNDSNQRNKIYSNLEKEYINIDNITCEESINFKFLEESFEDSYNNDNNINNNKITINNKYSFKSINKINITSNNFNITSNINNNENNHINNDFNNDISNLIANKNNEKVNIKTNKNVNININHLNDNNNNIENIQTNPIAANNKKIQNKNNMYINENFNLNSNNNINNKNDIHLNNNNDEKKKLVKKSFFSKDKEKINELELDQIPKEKYKILIVDDHTFIRSSLKINLEKILRDQNITNIEIIEGKDGVDIINLVIKDQENNNLIKCVFSDENMEYINGSEAFEILKNLESKNKIKKIPLCSVTAHEDTENLNAKSSKYKAIFDKILLKPCSQHDLLKFLREFRIF
jgi:CheY-like chemotaxis protein